MICRPLKSSESSHGVTTPSVTGPPHYRGFMITYNYAPQSVGILSTKDQLLAEISTWQHKKLTIDRYLCTGGIRTRKPRKRATADSRLRTRG